MYCNAGSTSNSFHSLNSIPGELVRSTSLYVDNHRLHEAAACACQQSCWTEMLSVENPKPHVPEAAVKQAFTVFTRSTLRNGGSLYIAVTRTLDLSLERDLFDHPADSLTDAWCVSVSFGL